MGTVYDAIDRERGARVAVKALSEVDATAAVRLKREFRAVADLAHPNLAAVYELAHEGGLWFFAMERIDGVAFTRWARGRSRDERTTSMIPVTRADVDLGATTRDLTGGPVTGLTGTPFDWYAVGTILYEVLTGRMPFEADSLLDLYFQKLHQTPVARASS